MATTSQIPRARRSVTGRHINRCLGMAPSYTQDTNAVSPEVRRLPKLDRHNLRADGARVVALRRPANSPPIAPPPTWGAGASEASTRRCLGRLLADCRPHSNLNWYGNPVRAASPGSRADHGRGGATGPITALSRGERQAGGMPARRGFHHRGSTDQRLTSVGAWTDHQTATPETSIERPPGKLGWWARDSERKSLGAMCSGNPEEFAVDAKKPRMISAAAAGFLLARPPGPSWGFSRWLAVRR